MASWRGLFPGLLLLSCGPRPLSTESGCAGWQVRIAAADHTCSMAASPYAPSRPLGYYTGDPLPVLTAYVTFDDGPTDWTTDFLDLLAARQVRATFFVNARNTKKGGLDGAYRGADGAQ